MRSAGWAAGFATFALVIVAAPATRAQVGARNFVEGIVSEDPNPSNEVVLVPGWSRESHSTNFSFAFSFEKQLSDSVSIELSDSYERVSPRHERTSDGFDDLEVLGKWAFFTSDRHEFRAAIGADIFAPAGNPDVGAQTHTRGGPLLMWQKGMGDLPAEGAPRYLRPFALQGDFGYFPAWGGPQSDQLVCDAMIDYSFAYLDSERLPVPLRDLVLRLDPFAEFNYEQIAAGRRRSTPPDFRVTPGLAWLWGPYQLTIGTQVALSRTASHNDQAAVIGLLDVVLDDVIPAVKWKPF